MNLYGPISKEACRISGSIILSEIGTYKSAYGKQFPEQRTSTGARQRSTLYTLGKPLYSNGSGSARIDSKGAEGRGDTHRRSAVGGRKLGLFVTTSRPSRYQSIWMPFAETDISECLKVTGKSVGRANPVQEPFTNSVGHNSTP